MRSSKETTSKEGRRKLETCFARHNQINSSFAESRRKIRPVQRLRVSPGCLNYLRLHLGRSEKLVILTQRALEVEEWREGNEVPRGRLSSGSNQLT
jgi:hypothetical protein